MRKFRRLQKKLTYLDKGQIQRIYQAFLLANKAHAGQKRTSGDLYITHPLAVAEILAEMHMDTESIMASLLHDVIEDTAIAKDEIEAQFGVSTAALVDGVTKLSRINFSTIAEVQAESFRKMIMAMSQDIRVILVKLADRLHNMHTVTALPPYKKQRIAKETLEIYAPIASRLGMHDLAVELENLSFAALYPRRYQVIADAIKKLKGSRKSIMKTIEKELKKTFAKSAVTKPIIMAREKHIYGMYRKMKIRHVSFSEIMDLYGCRIVVDTVDECYLALGIVHSFYKPMPGKFKDYIAIPKTNGYQSLHTTLFGPYALPIEIQIRTKKMDQVAAKGIAAHWLYKVDEKVDNSHVKAQQWINELLEMQQKTGNSLEFIENVKIDLFPKEIYVFTPRGGIIELPRGSTIIDFAYAIHTDIGNSCATAKVDYKFAPLSTVLTNGQTVAIITSPDGKPKPAWLNFVQTAKARSAIRHFLKRQQYFQVIDLGKKLLAKAMEELGGSLDEIIKRDNHKILHSMQLESLEKLYEEVGLGIRIARFVAYQLLTIAIKPQGIMREVPQKKPLLIKGTEGLAVHFATCCHPIPGDRIIGYLTKGKGLEVHVETCKRMDKFKEQLGRQGKCLLTRWADDVKGEFPVIIKIIMFNKQGSFAVLTKVISDLEVNLDDINIVEKSVESYTLLLKLLVKNVKQLNKVLRSVKNLAIVTSVNRV